MDVKATAEARWRARTDLFWLATELLHYDLVEEVHRPITDFFVRKSPEIPYQQLDPRKWRLLLYPRGHYKTTIDIADCVQWLINYPSIRLLLMSGTQDLTKKMLAEIENHFTSNEEFLKYFPEFECNAKQAKVMSLELPSNLRRIKFREHTISIATVETTKAGSHYDVGKFDDVVTEENSQNPEQLEQTIADTYAVMVPIIMADGYRDVIGTRYDNSDLYGYILEEDNKNGKWSTLVQTAYKADGSLLFPVNAAGRTVMTADFLENERLQRPLLWACQYMNNPNLVPEISPFSEQELRKQFIDERRIPLLVRDMDGRRVIEGRVFLMWDLAFSLERHSDYTAGVAVFYDKFGNMYIIDGVCGRFSPDELLMKMLVMSQTWKPWLATIAIEKAGGSQLLEPSLRDACRRYNLDVSLDWLTVKTNKKAKDKRIFGLQPILKAKQLWFSNRLTPEFSEMLIKQFSRWPKYSHRDIPDAVALAAQYRSRIDLVPPRSQLLEEREERFDLHQVVGSEGLSAGLVG